MNLHLLALIENSLSSITFGELPELVQLYLSDNGLSNLVLPENLQSLIRINVPNNQLTTLTIPPGSSSLQYFDVTGNPIITLEVTKDFDVDEIRRLEGFLIADITFYRFVEAVVSNGQLALSWPKANGILQCTDSLNREWEDVSGASSPFEADMSGPQKFYRVLLP